MSFYKDADSLGEDISIPNFFKFVPTYKGTVETPIYEVKEVTEEIPYVSFDSEGDEITLYRTKIKQEKVKIGSEKVEKVFYDKEAINKPIEYCYKELKARLGEIIPVDKLEII